MIEAIQGGFGALKGALDIVQGLQAFKTEAAVNRAVIDIQRRLMEVQSALAEAEVRHAADIARIQALEQEIVRLEHGAAQRQGYQLAQVAPGAFAYTLEPGVDGGKPTHWLCVQCFDQGRNSLLQARPRDTDTATARGRDRIYGCNACGATISVPWNCAPGR